ncbi:biotin--[acetyl-CoA-carboxylase] ligase [Vogesella oryzae]|uniref:biotin--[acetyl-CoA-carboxylase] ligase n=1 Tax=Vogesella oryzae TaxID=1735285 RepID=UPI0015821DF5|nr:biotin--[acetyl-CoA-carboxylase] ligase [Vogesella oryzae]
MSALAFAVLRQLADGRFHSGEDMAQVQGCSRTLIWQAVHKLENDFGMTVFSVRGQGYRLPQAFELLEVARVRAGLDDVAANVWTLATADEIDSSNTQLMMRAAQGAPHGLVLAVERQTAGRGRLGRRWQMPLGAGLTFSVLWRFDRGLSGLAGLSLVVGVAMVRALRSFKVPVQLKWPNDVLLNGRKLAGILIELSGDALGPAAVVIGIGLNMQSPGEVDQPVASLAEAGCQVGRNALLAELLNQLAAVLATFDREGFAAFRNEWTDCAAFLQQPVLLRFSHGEPVAGVALGVDDHGALLVDCDGEQRVFHVGEVSLRAAS